MQNTHITNIEAIKAEILASLGYDPKNPPSNLEDKQAAAVLGLKAGTLSVWRSTGRYNFVRDHKPELLAEATASLSGGFQKGSEVRAETWWRGVLLELRCTKAHLFACGVVTEADITPAVLGEYISNGITSEVFACALRRCENWRLPT